MVMLGLDIPKHLKSNGMKCYPGMDESDDEDLDAMSESYDIQMGKYFRTPVSCSTFHAEIVFEN